MKPTTQQLFATHNKKLLTDIMEKDEPVLCNSFSDAKDIAFDYYSALSLKIKQELPTTNL